MVTVVVPASMALSKRDRWAATGDTVAATTIAVATAEMVAAATLATMTEAMDAAVAPIAVVMPAVIPGIRVLIELRKQKLVLRT